MKNFSRKFFRGIKSAPTGCGELFTHFIDNAAVGDFYDQDINFEAFILQPIGSQPIGSGLAFCLMCQCANVPMCLNLIILPYSNKYLSIKPDAVFTNYVCNFFQVSFFKAFLLFFRQLIKQTPPTSIPHDIPPHL